MYACSFFNAPVHMHAGSFNATTSIHTGIKTVRIPTNTSDVSISTICQ